MDNDCYPSRVNRMRSENGLSSLGLERWAADNRSTISAGWRFDETLVVGNSQQRFVERLSKKHWLLRHLQFGDAVRGG